MTIFAFVGGEAKTVIGNANQALVRQDRVVVSCKVSFVIGGVVKTILACNLFFNSDGTRTGIEVNEIATIVA